MLIIDLESDCGCPSKNKTFSYVPGEKHIVIKSKPFIENTITVPIDLLKTFLSMIEEK